ncbi:MAG TPA: hypothetical protein DCQ32_06960 [Cyanobacteria bacterium UBA8156]|nr:hypothetical protein [Cyanobacteria bacterium UBA8156]
MVETSDPKMTAVLSAPGELVAVLRQVVDLYNNGHQAATLNALQSAVLQLQEQASADETLLVAVNESEEIESTFLKSWSDILSVEVYVDTEIYAPMETLLPAQGNPEYQQAATDYLQSWQDVAQQLGRVSSILPEPALSSVRSPRVRLRYRGDRPAIRQRRFE